jgi:hypothetical protein
MIRKEFDYTKDGDIGYLSFTPPVDASFTPMRVAVPPVENRLTRSNFAQELEQVIRTSCGLGGLCVGSCFAGALEGQLTSTGEITGATLICRRINCPLGEPPASGDSEPLIPIRPQPSLSAEQEISSTI